MSVVTKTAADTTALDTTLAERYVREHLESRHGGERSPVAAAVVSGFDASIERKDSLRRVVLVGRWEVDPAAPS